MSYSDTNNSALDTSAGFADISYTVDTNATLSPLAANDIEAQTDYVQVDEDSGDEETIEERFVQEDGTVVIKVKKIKKIKKAAKKVTKNANELADATVKLVAVAVDNMQDSSNELPEGVITTGKWDARLLSCFDFCVPNCLMATFCPCVTVAQVASRIGFSYKNVLLAFGALIAIEYIFWVIAMATVRTTESVDGYYYSSLYGGYIDYTYSIQTSRWPVWGYISSLATIAMFIGVWQLRTKVRERFQLPGSACEDCLISFFCSCCSIAQLATHVKSYKQGSCDFGPPDELRAYEH